MAGKIIGRDVLSALGDSVVILLVLAMSFLAIAMRIWWEFRWIILRYAMGTFAVVFVLLAIWIERENRPEYWQGRKEEMLREHILAAVSICTSILCLLIALFGPLG
jgi:hypothetical protein